MMKRGYDLKQHPSNRNWFQHFMLLWFIVQCSSVAVDHGFAISGFRSPSTARHYKNEQLRWRRKQLAFLVNTSKSILERYPLINALKDTNIEGSETTPAPERFQSGLWAVKLKLGKDDTSRQILDLSAELIAKRHGLENHGQIGELKGYYLFTKRGESNTWTTMVSAVASTNRETRPAEKEDLETYTSGNKLTDSPTSGDVLSRTKVEWQGQQKLLYRSKRFVIPETKENPERYLDRTTAMIDSSRYKDIETSTKLNTTTTVTVTGPLMSTPHPASDEEKSRHQFYIHVAKQNIQSSTITHHVAGVTPNPKYQAMIGNDVAGGAGSRRMGLDFEDEEIGSVNAKENSLGLGRYKDPLYIRQWHLENLSENNNIGDCNVTGVWERGVTGKGVVVAVVDDGVQWDHPDLIENYCAEGSFDLNSNDDDPMPVRDDKEENKHGTRCAGEIAAAPNNHCGIGIAHGAKFSGIRILDGPLTDSMEAAAFNKHFDINDIYSCSWGPEDDGETVDGPHPLAQAALQHGIIKGRQGYGSVYIVASGNGGHKGDNCNYDGYANSIYTITIGAVDEYGRVPTYAEECASMLACTFSSGAGAEDGNARKIVTTDWTLGKNKRRMNGCTESHTGTSAATPLAAGMVALMLEARPCLSWRDVQHIMAMTAVQIHPDKDDWTINTAGFHHSDKKGFGLLNAWRLVNAARVWQHVPWLTALEVKCHDKRKLIPNTKSRALITTTLITKDECSQKMLNTLEQVSIIVDIDHPRRGDLFITLVCPSGTTSTIGRPRKNDASTTGLWNWAFTTVKCWGEEPHGIYRLIIHDTRNKPGTLSGELRSWKLILYGSSQSKEEIEKQRHAVIAAMSGEYLQSWYRNHDTQSSDTKNSNLTSHINQIGYCPSTNKQIHKLSSLLQESTTERMLKVLSISGCFLLLWGLYFIFDIKKMGDSTMHSHQENDKKELLKHEVTVNTS